MSKQFTPKEVADANLHIIIDGGVFDVSGFVDEHPGGKKILTRVAGKDASKQFWKVSPQDVVVRLKRWRADQECAQYHNEGVLKKYTPKLKVGELKEESKL